VCGIGWVWEWKQTPLKLGERPGGEAGSILPGDTGAEPFALSAVAADLPIGRGSWWRGFFLGALERSVESSFVILVHNLRFGYCGVEWLFGMVCCCAVVAADGVAAVALLLALPFGLTVLHGGFNSCGCLSNFFFSSTLSACYPRRPCVQRLAPLFAPLSSAAAAAREAGRGLAVLAATYIHSCDAQIQQKP
jgi:hypothetical protein